MRLKRYQVKKQTSLNYSVEGCTQVENYKERQGRGNYKNPDGSHQWWEGGLVIGRGTQGAPP